MGGSLCFRVVLLLFLAAARPGFAQQWDWVRRWTNGTGAATSVGLDAAGSIYFAGEFQGTNQLGTNTLISAGGSDVFVAKLNGAGDLLWAIATGGTNDDRASRLLVTSNGILYLCGQFTITPTLLAPSADTNTGLTNVFLARIDEGHFTWLRSDSNVVSSTSTLGPDETPWLLASSNRVFYHHYSAAGTLLHGTPVGESSFFPRGIAVDAQERVYITGLFFYDVDLGETNLSHFWWSVFTAGLDTNGLARWAWKVQQDNADSAGLAVAPDGTIVSVGRWGTPLPQNYGFVVKHSADGELLWRHDHTEDFKGGFSAHALFIDRHGIIHVAGSAIQRFPLGSGARQNALWLFDLAPGGQKLTQSFVVNYAENSPARSTAIVLNSAGDTFLAGAIGGQPRFGTNLLGGAGPIAVEQPFVARRPTITPELRVTHTPTEVTLHWPHTALPFVLQANASLDSNTWSDIVFPQTNGSKHVALPANAAHRFFRLRSTNEVPILHPPYIFHVRIEMFFLGRTNTAITVSNSAAAVPFVAAAEDEDETMLSFTWGNHDTDAALVNGTTSDRFFMQNGRSFWIARWNDPQTSWPLGLHSIRFVATDGVFSVTNVQVFEVITIHDAIAQLITAVETATTEPERSNLVAPLQLADAALTGSDYAAARGHLDEFNNRVRNNPQLTTAQQALFESSANALKTVFPSSG